MAVERMEVLRKLLEMQKEKRLSHWKNGVIEYAKELIEDEYNYEKIPCNFHHIQKRYLNGAESWSEYFYAGFTLIYDSEIAKRLCTPTELKKTKVGKLRPNKNENWLDTQARALYQACWLICDIVLDMTE